MNPAVERGYGGVLGALGLVAISGTAVALEVNDDRNEQAWNSTATTPSASPSTAPSETPSEAPSQDDLDTLRENGDPYPDHSEEEGDRLSAKGNPNSSVDLNKDGEVVQRRYYGSDGKAVEDIDYSHSNGDGTHEFPHRHTWTDGVRGK